MDEKLFVNKLKEHNISLSEKQKEQFSLYFDLLIEWNEKINLTAITEKNEVYLKHFYDSITPSFYLDFTNTLSICDVGAGAGFPSIPLKICFPHLHVTIVDSLQKRINFLNELINQLQLDNITLVHSRAEDAGKNKSYRESFDIVTARAVANMCVLSEYCLPLCKVNGFFIAFKGSNAIEELNESQKAISILGGKVENQHFFTLPKEDSERAIFVIKKIKKTPRKYPRKAGVPNKSPLI